MPRTKKSETPEKKIRKTRTKVKPAPVPDTSKVFNKLAVDGRLRSAPKQSSALLINVPRGTYIEVISIVEYKGELWAKTAYAGYNGFIPCRHLTK